MRILFFRKKTAYNTFLNCSLTSSILFYLVFTIEYVYQINVVHLNAFQLVLTGVTLQFFCVVFEIPTGIIADFYSRKASVIIGFSLTGIGFLVEGLIPSFYAVLVAQAIWGVGSTFISGSLQAWVVDEEKDIDIDKVFIRGSQYEQLGAVVGIILSVLIGNINKSLPIILGGSFFIIFSVYLSIIMTENNFKGTKPEISKVFTESIVSFKGSWHVVSKSKLLLLFLGITLSWGLASEGYDRLWTIHILDNFNINNFILNDVTMVGAIQLVSMLLVVFLMEIIIKKMETGSLKISNILFMVNLINIAMIVIFSLSKNVAILALVHIMIVILRSVNQPILNICINKNITQKVRATVLSMYSQMDNIGQIVGGLIVAFITGQISTSFGILSTILFLCPAIIFIAMLTRTNRG